MKSVYMLLGLVALLLGVALLFPHNTLTGRSINTNNVCGAVGCVKLCDVGASTDATAQICGKEFTCCPTHWSSGVCDYSFNCEKIREYSLYQSLETYQDSVREQPAAVQPTFTRFFLPLIIIVAAIIGVIYWYHNPYRGL